MSGQNNQKLKLVLDAVPNGFLIDSHWMRTRSVARQSVHDYLGRGWLERAGHGLYRRPARMRTGATAAIDWKTAVLSAQWIMDYPIHVGGESALQLAGHVHYMTLGVGQPVFLYGEQFPTWLAKLDVGARIEKRSTKLFSANPFGLESEGDATTPTAALGAGGDGLWRLRVSTPERAILEELDELPKSASFHVVDMAFQGLTNLRPKRISKLLSLCTSVKVKRLFFVFADRHGHAWLKHLDRTQIDLGQGDRELVKGGRLHKTYRITVPAELLDGGVNAD